MEHTGDEGWAEELQACTSSNVGVGGGFSDKL